MAKPIVVSIPHELGREEARRRIEEGIGRITHQFGEGVKLTKAWEGDCLAFSAKVVGQAVAGAFTEAAAVFAWRKPRSARTRQSTAAAKAPMAA